MSQERSIKGLMALVKTYATQRAQCVLLSDDGAFWSLQRELDRMEGELVLYVDAMLHHSYAEGRSAAIEFIATGEQQ